MGDGVGTGGAGRHLSIQQGIARIAFGNISRTQGACSSTLCGGGKAGGHLGIRQNAIDRKSRKGLDRLRGDGRVVVSSAGIGRRRRNREDNTRRPGKGQLAVGTHHRRRAERAIGIDCGNKSTGNRCQVITTLNYVFNGRAAINRNAVDIIGLGRTINGDSIHLRHGSDLCGIGSGLIRRVNHRIRRHLRRA